MDAAGAVGNVVEGRRKVGRTTTLLEVNWREFVATLIRTLAWPATIIVLVLIFRKKVTALLSVGLSRIKIGSFLEAEWAAGVQAAGADLTQALERIEESRADEANGAQGDESSSLTGAAESPRRDEDHSQRQTSEDNKIVTSQEGSPEAVLGVPMDRLASAFDSVEGVLREAGHLVSVSPHAAVLIGFRALEEALEFFRSALGVADGRGNLPVGATVHALRNEGYISARTADAIDRLRRLRNTLAHSTPDKSTVTVDVAEDYLKTLRVAVDVLVNPFSIYEGLVVKNLRAIGIKVRVDISPDFGDFVVETFDGKRATVDLRFSQTGKPVRLKIIQAMANAVRKTGSRIVVVTNAPLPDEVREFNSAGRGSDQVEALTWRGPQDNDLLARVISRRAR